VGRHGLAAPASLAREDYGLASRGMLGDARFDLPRLDAKAANSDLMVDTAEELDVAVRQQAHEIAGLVQPGCRLRAKRIRDELLGGELRPVQVARGELHTAH